MHMLSRAVLLGAALLVRGQARLPRSAPSFQNSIVNLGKIDIVLNLDRKNPLDIPSTSFQNEMHMEPCPCGLHEHYGADSLLLKRLLPPSMAPSFHQSCCDFPESLFPDTKQNMPLFPFPLENVVPKSLQLIPMGRANKQMEIIFFPPKGVQARKHKGDTVKQTGDGSSKLDKEPAGEYPKLDSKSVGGRGPEYPIVISPTDAPKTVKRDLKVPQSEVSSPPSDTNIL